MAEIQRRAASAWLAFVERREADALADMRAAATLEDGTEKAAVTPGPLAPARELLGEMLLEFTSQPGRFYNVEYANPGAAWRRSPLRIRAAGSRVQWIDRGPPQTDSPPSAHLSRTYRVREVAP